MQGVRGACRTDSAASSILSFFEEWLLNSTYCVLQILILLIRHRKWYKQTAEPCHVYQANKNAFNNEFLAYFDTTVNYVGPQEAALFQGVAATLLFLMTRDGDLSPRWR